MNIIIICLIIAVLLPYLAKLPLVVAMKDSKGGYDNNYPRLQQSELKDFGARALAAHQNSFEALIIFSTSALTVLATNSITTFTEFTAILFILCRLLYHTFYLLNWATLRTSIWALSLLCCLALLGACL